MNTIDSFEAFVEFISNIDQQKATITSLKEATKQYQVATATLSKGQDLAKWEAVLQAKQDKMTSDNQSVQQSLNNQNGQLTQRSQELDAREAKLNNRESLVKSEELAVASATTAIQQKSAELDKKENDLNTQISVYNQKLAELSAKQDALAKVFK